MNECSRRGSKSLGKMSLSFRFVLSEFFVFKKFLTPDENIFEILLTRQFKELVVSH